ncbi:MAG: ABC transporter substrate-binding protein [Caenispirillum bisanense]|nr:ABC transporter substrate-binding protein [Caenispirillum bisanense]MCA1971861.1 ABC transporter substrate-binding protein [Caenispirillum sp.]
MKKLTRLATITATFCLLVSSQGLAGEKVTIRDVAGREVALDVPVDKVILGEGRQIYMVAALDTEDPFKRVVAWRDDLGQADPDTYSAYKAKYPFIDDIPTFGGIKDGTFDVEQAVALDPDVLIMNIESKAATDDAGLIAKLDQVDIPVIYVDFREKPMENTEKSMHIFGKLFGKEDKAEEFIAFRAEQIAVVTDRLAQEKPEKPVVFIDRAGGYSDDCCMSFGAENFGKMVEIAGGINIASEIIPGTFGTVNPEQIIASNPEQIIVTGGNWEHYVPGGNWVGVAPGADLKEARRKLAALMERPAFTGVQAAEKRQVHAIWHQFYNSPYQFVAIQQIAKWLHPDLFRDIDPEATFRSLHERFLPVEYQPGYFTSLSAGE